MSATTNSAKVAGAGSSGGGAGGGAGKLPLPKSAIVLQAHSSRGDATRSRFFSSSCRNGGGGDGRHSHGPAAATLAMWTQREGYEYELVGSGQRQHRAPPTSSSCRLFFVLVLIVGILLGLHRKSIQSYAAISVAEPSLQPPMPPEPAPAPPPPPPPPARGRRDSAPS